MKSGGEVSLATTAHTHITHTADAERGGVTAAGDPAVHLRGRNISCLPSTHQPNTHVHAIRLLHETIIAAEVYTQSNVHPNGGWGSSLFGDTSSQETGDLRLILRR
jgi:hypothetical protein